MRNKPIGVVLGLVIAGALLVLQYQQMSRPRPELLSEADGAIRAVAIQYTQATGPSTAPCYRSFLGQLRSNRKVVVVCRDSADAASFEKTIAALVKTRHDYEMVVVGKPITTWCKDRFLVGRGRPTRLLCPAYSSTGLETRFNDASVAPAIVDSLPGRFACQELTLHFDAGDVLATRSKVIVSDSLWNKNSRPERFPSLLRRQFGGDVVWLRNVPDHHIGMYAAPLDDSTVVVGYPALGRKLWTAESTKKLGTADFTRATCAPFENAARQLRSAGFRVIRAPLVVLGRQVYVTYTNGVFETRGGRRTVYMPTYGLEELDQAGRKAYESAGWEVRPVPVQTVFRYRGTIGCLVNVLERDGI